MRNAQVMVSISFGYGETVQSAMEIASPYEEAFEPLDCCTEPLIPTLIGGNHVTEATYQRAMRMRKDIARALAADLSAHLVKMMREKDTINGYPIERDA